MPVEEQADSDAPPAPASPATFSKLAHETLVLLA